MAFNSRHVELSKASSVVHILWKFFLSISTVHAAAATLLASEYIIIEDLSFPRIKARTLAHITGKIISMSPVIGNLSRLMTRYCYMAIVKRFSWDTLLVFDDVKKIKSELYFWQSNINAINC
jgi:hypothetical protein